MATTTSPGAAIRHNLPAKTVTFLTAVSRHPNIYAILRTRGYTADDHEEGWTLLHAAVGRSVASGGVEPRSAATDAIDELTVWEQNNARWIRAALDRKYAEQGSYLFDNVEPTEVVGALVAVTTLLDRLDDLQSGADRKSSRKHDHAALELLSSRGLTLVERKRLRALVTTATALPTATEDTAESQAASDGALVALNGWYNDWSTLARSIIKRRDQLISLGLARRRSGRAAEKAPPASVTPAKSTDATKPATNEVASSPAAVPTNSTAPK